MNLVIEDGTNVAGANSYASADDMYLYAIERNIEVPNDVGELEALLLRAMDYIEMNATRYLGTVSVVGQPLAFPRLTTSSFGGSASLGVPAALKKAQIIAAIAAQTIDLTPVSAAGADMAATRKTVGPITVEYEKTGTSVSPRLPQVDVLLRPYFSGGFGQPNVVRG